MRDPLTAGHELPIGVLAERVAHAAVAACQADAALHRRRHVVDPLLLDSSHRPYGHDQVKRLQLLAVGECFQRIGYFNLEAFLDELSAEDLRYLLGLVAIPSAPYD